MKITNTLNKYLLVLTLLTCKVVPAQTEVNTQWKNQINMVFNDLDKTKIPHEILIDYAMEFIDIPAYNGTLTDSTLVDANILGSIYKTVFMGKVTTNTQHFDLIEDVAQNWVTHRQNYNANDKNTLVLAGLYYQYARFNPNALNDSTLTVTNNILYDKYINGVWQNPYQSDQTIAFALPVKTYNKLNFEVVLPQNLLLSNSANTVQAIEVDFNDGSGFNTITLDQKTVVNYSQDGIYNWVFKISLTTGTALYSQTKIKITAKETAGNTNQNSQGGNQNRVVIPGPSSNFPNNYNGAILQIDYAPIHNEQLTRPLIVAEGFDPGSILNPEIEGGDRTLNPNFYNDLDNSGNQLRSLLDFDATQEYDIVYIDWQNGTNSIQHNSEVLKNVIDWVNTNKVGTEPNVLLGQSMGGVIGRYTLANMEAVGDTHDVRLFIAHDAPMQGANTPLSIQYFTRHAYDQYTEVPALFNTVEVVIPTILNLLELMSAGNINWAIPSLNDVLTLQDTPAAMQMNYHYVDIDSNPTTSIHNAWQQEFEGAGYPQLSWNVAISNGNECAVDHGFNPRAKFINLHDTHDPGFWGDLVHAVATPLIGNIIGDPELFFLGQLPGGSTYFFDFDLHANPDVNESNRNVYYGKLRYEKELFWFITISHTITERSKSAPYGYLPFDTYSGGFIDIESTIGDYSDNLPANTIVNPRYGFIPVVSALDIKRNNNNVSPSDYLRNYAGGTTPEPALTTDFDNFIVDFAPNSRINNAHISFQPRNGNWLANELNEDANVIIDCSAFCANVEIVGNDFLCDEETYSVTTEATFVDWEVIDPDNLVAFTTNGNEITITRVNPNLNGFITLSVFYNNNACGTADIFQDIWVGNPTVNTNGIIGGYDNVSINSTTQFSVAWAEGNESYFWAVTPSTTCSAGSGPTIQPSNTNTVESTSRYAYVNWGVCPGTYIVACFARNDCGDTYIGSKWVTVYDPNNTNPCNDAWELKTYPNPVKEGVVTFDKLPPGNPCDQVLFDKILNSINKVVIYDFYGNIAYENEFDNKTFTITGLYLTTGTYVVHLLSDEDYNLQKVIIVD